MIKRTWHIASVVFILAVATGFSGCGDSNVETIEQGEGTDQGAAGQSATEASNAAGDVSAAGITWTVPSAWEIGRERRMRVATYEIGSGEESAECAVFYFGPGQGGGVQANIDRWVGQFDQPDGSDSRDKAAIDKQEIAGLEVTTIDLTGTFNGSMGGPMSGQQAEHPNWRMLGAIIEAPEGPVFFKLMGPEDVVEQATHDFQELVASVKKA